MKNRFGLLAAWLLATAVAVGVASQAVGLVANRAIKLPAQIPIALDGQSSFGPITLPPADPSTPTTVGTATSTTATGVPASTSSTTTVSAPTSSTVVTATTTTTSVAPATTTTTTPPPPLDSGTFFVTGGQVSAACTGPDTIQLLGTVPASGWSLEVESSGPAQVRVDFESGEQESEVEVVCRNGQLLEDISD